MRKSGISQNSEAIYNLHDSEKVRDSTPAKMSQSSAILYDRSRTKDDTKDDTVTK